MEGFFTDCFPDVRLSRRGAKILSDMQKHKSAVINQFCGTHSEQQAGYRFFHNTDVGTECIKQGIYADCSRNSRGLDVLCIQDTSEANYRRLWGKLKANDPDIGPVGNNTDPGFFIHPSLVIDKQEFLPLGFSSLIQWNRRWDKADKHERGYKNLPIEEKESYRWISSVQTSKDVLKEASHITVVGDRESDIFEELALVPDARTDLLIRSSINRKLHGEGQKLFETLAGPGSRAYLHWK